jgi:hypothetical protein
VRNAIVEEVEFCGCTNEELEAGKTCGQPQCPNAREHNFEGVFCSECGVDEASSFANEPCEGFEESLSG